MKGGNALNTLSKTLHALSCDSAMHGNSDDFYTMHYDEDRRFTDNNNLEGDEEDDVIVYTHMLEHPIREYAFVISPIRELAETIGNINYESVKSASHTMHMHALRQTGFFGEAIAIDDILGIDTVDLD